jgi:hypothetical protein
MRGIDRYGGALTFAASARNCDAVGSFCRRHNTGVCVMSKMFAMIGAATSALILATSPVQAEGKADRARTAIAEARGKVQTLGTLGAGGDLPRMVAQAQAALRSADDNLKGGHKDEAIADAHRASELADTAIGLSKQRQDQSAAAQQAAAVDATLAAQQDAAAANARATAAQQAADAAAADAAAARAAPPVVVAQPAPSTTVTTETTKTAAVASTPRAAPRRVVKRTVNRTATRARPTVTEKTTTTVRTSN